MGAAALSEAKLIGAIQKSRGLIAVAARSLGVGRKTIYNRAEKSEAIREAIAEARDFTTDTAEAALFKAISDGEAWAVCFYLKCQGKHRGYSEKVEHEHSGPDGGPLEITVTRQVVPLAKNRIAAGTNRANGKNGHGRP